MVNLNKRMIEDSGPDKVKSDEEYYCRAQYLLEETRGSLTTIEVARGVLERIGRREVRRVLFLGGNEGVDYVRDSLLHGFKLLMEELGGEVGETRRGEERRGAQRRC